MTSGLYSLALSFITTAQSLGTLMLALAGISFLIAFHELGHFLFCKLFGIHTPSFSIGFGPRLLSQKIGQTEFSISAIPLGGYVEIAGSAEVGQGSQEYAHSTGPDSFAKKPYYQKLLVMMGGILFNLIFAYLTFIGIAKYGISNMLLPGLTSTTISAITPNSPAMHAGLKIGDRIITLQNIPVENDAYSLIKTLIKIPSHEPIAFTVQRNGERNQLVIEKTSLPDQKRSSLGFELEKPSLHGLSLKEAIAWGIHITNQALRMTLEAFAHPFSKEMRESIGGPVKIIAETAKTATMGWIYLFVFLAFLSINLAILNVIPLPILDGGQLVFYTVEAIIGRSIPIKIKEWIFIACWILILGMIVYLSFFEITELLAPLLHKFSAFFR